MAIEMTMKQMKAMTKFAWVEDISKADADKCNTIKEEEKHLELVAVSTGMYGVSGKMWRGEQTGKMFVALNYSANIYRF